MMVMVMRPVGEREQGPVGIQRELFEAAVHRSTGGPLTGMRSVYFWRIRSASALRFSKGCSSLNLLRILTA